MNVRIELLAVQSGFNIHNDVIDGHNFNHEIQKFAELIVRECAGLVDHVIMEDGTNRGDFIRKHFGVEE